MQCIEGAKMDQPEPGLGLHRGKLGRILRSSGQGGAAPVHGLRETRGCDAQGKNAGGTPALRVTSRNEDSINVEREKKSGEGEEPFPLFGGGGLFFLSLSGTWWCAPMVKTRFCEKCFGRDRVSFNAALSGTSGTRRANGVPDVCGTRWRAATASRRSFPNGI